MIRLFTGLKEHNWKSPSASDYIVELMDRVKHVYNMVKTMKLNLKEVRFLCVRLQFLGLFLLLPSPSFLDRENAQGLRCQTDAAAQGQTDHCQRFSG